MVKFEKDYAVRSHYWSDDDFLAELREVAGSDLSDAEKLELLVRKLDVLSDEDVRRTNKDRPIAVYVSEGDPPYDPYLEGEYDSDETGTFAGGCWMTWAEYNAECER